MEVPFECKVILEEVVIVNSSEIHLLGVVMTYCMDDVEVEVAVVDVNNVEEKQVYCMGVVVGHDGDALEDVVKADVEANQAKLIVFQFSSLMASLEMVDSLLKQVRFAVSFLHPHR